MSFQPDNTQNNDSLSSKISSLLSDSGVPAHQQTALLTRLCGLSISQARRKLQGAAWSFLEVAAVMRHLGLPLDHLLDPPHSEGEGFFSSPAKLRISGSFHLGSSTLPCSVLLGAKLTGEAPQNALLGVLIGENWHVGEKAQLSELLPHGAAFFINELLVHPVTSKPVHIAFLDDDYTTVDTLTAWFREAGYEASGFSTTEELLSETLEEFDAFVVDYLLTEGESARETISLLREKFPGKPIALLTGKLQDGTVAESDVIPMLRALNVLFFEKPVRPSVLAAALQNAIDQQID